MSNQLNQNKSEPTNNILMWEGLPRQKILTYHNWLDEMNHKGSSPHTLLSVIFLGMGKYDPL